MQDRYVGDIGDFVKLGFLRSVAKGLSLGVAWYLYPDEAHNTDGRHVDYLDQTEKWRHLDPELFDELFAIIKSGVRKVSCLESESVLPGAEFSRRPFNFDGDPVIRGQKRGEWFLHTTKDLVDCEIVFADPDNGICENSKFRKSNPKFWKRIPVLFVRVILGANCSIAGP